MMTRSSSLTVNDMSATQVTSALLPAFDSLQDADAAQAVDQANNLTGRWHVIAAAQGSISRNPRNVVERFETSGTRLESSLSFERLSGSATTTRRRVFDMGTNDGLLSLIQTSLEIVFVDDDHAVVAEGRRLRILSRTPDISPRAFFQRVSHARENGFCADDLRMIPKQ